MPVVHMPDGANVMFPDDMQPDQIKSLILQKFPGAGGPPPEMSMADAVTQGVQNIPSSAAKFASDVIQPVLHPADTLENIGKLGAGVIQKIPGANEALNAIGISTSKGNEDAANLVGKFLVDRYGSIAAVKNTLANDPVGLAADLSLALTGLGAGVRGAGVAGDVSNVVSKAGRVTDPLSIIAPALQKTGSLAADIIGGVGTQTGGTPLKIAAQAGFEGGDAARAFKENLRGTATLEDVVADARNAVRELKAQRGSAYKEGMAKIGADTTVLDFNKIESAVESVAKVKNYKGQDLAPATKSIRDEVLNAVEDWKQLDPKEFHTPEGLDALKQKIGDIRDSTQYGTPQRVIVDGVYNAIKKTITEQAPEYARVMKGYEEASKQISEIEKTLSLNPNARVDTALRKLQSTLRENVNTNFGQRAVLAKYLVDAGAPHLMEKLAGQALNPVAPAGLGKLAAAVAAETGVAAAAAAGGAIASPAVAGVLGTLPFMSPRVMGNAAYYSGAAARKLGVLPNRAIGQSAFQAGRLPNNSVPLGLPWQTRLLPSP